MAEANPTDLEEAFRAAIAAEARNSWVRTSARIEEPLEIGALLPPPPQMPAEKSFANIVETLQSLVEKLEKGQQTICYYCRKTGHISRECKKKKKDVNKKQRVSTGTLPKN